MHARKAVVKPRALPNLQNRDITEIQAEEYLLALRHPYEAYQRGASPAYPDPEGIQALYRWSTRLELDVSSVANGTAYDIWCRVSPAGLAHLMVATTFTANLPSAFSNYDDTSYNTWATTLFKKRMVACELRFTNRTAVLDQAGTCMMGIFPATFSNTKLFNQLSQMPGVNIRTLADPGTIGRFAWKPAEDMENNDTILVDPATPIGFYDSSLLVWGTAPTAWQGHVEIITFWEGAPLMEAADFIQPILKAPSIEHARRIAYKSLIVDGDGSTNTNVIKDDGGNEDFMRSVDGVLGNVRKGVDAGYKLFEAAKGLAGPVSSLFSWAGSLFGHERVKRILSLLNDEDLELLRNALSNTRTRNEVLIKLSAYEEPERKSNDDVIARRFRE